MVPESIAVGSLSPGGLSGKKILIVEDEKLTRVEWTVVLQHEGCDVHLAANGKEALACLGDGPIPDLILLDMFMPVEDGWIFLHQLKTRPDWAAIPVIIITAMGAASLEWASSMGAAGFLRKPVEDEELLDTIKRFCR
jgi:CheY-like chemotaxis protein